MQKFIPLAACAVAATYLSASIAQAQIQLDTKTKAAIVLPQNATAAEQTAANDLQNYLTKITGGQFTVQPENGTPTTTPAIYVGATHFAASSGLPTTKLPSEEWHIQVRGQNLILAGGGSRGTLYATYRFLEDHGSVRWWNPFEETVPSRRPLHLPALSSKGKPFFAYRDIYQTYGNDEGRFAIRNRLNRDGDAPIAAKYGGSNDYGPPYFVHTFFKILPPQKYFKDHPEWYIGNGKNMPTMHNAQLALSNPAMRQEFLKQFRELIRKTHQNAREKGLPEPLVFSVSQEDNNVQFATPADAALVAENGGADGAVLIDFVNFLADEIKEEFPDLYIDTLAYYSGEKAPTKIRPRDNVIIRLTDTTSNLLLPVTHPRNHVFHDNLVAWSKIAKNLRVWDYSITYRIAGLPMPTAHTFGPDFRFFAAHNVEGVFLEHENPVLADLRDLKVWMQCKLLEDPQRDPNALINEFTNGFYGPAAPHVRRYLTALEQQVTAQKTMPEVDWFAPIYRHRYLTAEFATRADAIFDDAARAVAGDEVLSRRVRHARLPLDRAVVLLFNQWERHARQTGKPLTLDREKFVTRALKTQTEQVDMRIVESARAAQYKKADDEVAQSRVPLPPLLPTPEKFVTLTPESYVMYGSNDTRNAGGVPKVVTDEQAQSGIATRLEIADADLETYKLPLQWGIYDVASKKTLQGGNLNAADVAGHGYHWYKLGTGAISETSYLYFLRNWFIQIDMHGLNPDRANQPFEIWANLKFEGPAFPHGKEGEKNAISLERVVLVKK